MDPSQKSAAAASAAAVSVCAVKNILNVYKVVFKQKECLCWNSGDFLREKSREGAKKKKIKRAEHNQVVSKSVFGGGWCSEI